MNTHCTIKTWSETILSLLLASALAGQTSAQDFPSLIPDLSRNPLIPRQALIDAGGDSVSLDRNAGAASKVRLFRMQTGFLVDPVGLDMDDDTALRAGDVLPPAGASPDPLDGRLGLLMGTDNPFFDFQAPGDPGGVGYYKIHSQYQLFEDQNTCLSVGFQAFTPAGLENDGLSNRPTIVRPTIACSHAWDGGTAIHGFVGKPVMARAGWTDRPERGLTYGLALQSPVAPVDAAGNGLHMFVEAVGNSRPGLASSQTPAVNWEVIPGLHWQVRDNWWMSSGVVVPLNTTRYDPGLVQITCSFRF